MTKKGKALVGIAGYRRFLKSEGRGCLTIDPAKVEADARFDGLFVPRTDTELIPIEVMLRYQQLLVVEQTCRTANHSTETRPIYQRLDESLRGHDMALSSGGVRGSRTKDCCQPC